MPTTRTLGTQRLTVSALGLGPAAAAFGRYATAADVSLGARDVTALDATLAPGRAAGPRHGRTRMAPVDRWRP